MPLPRIPFDSFDQVDNDSNTTRVIVARCVSAQPHDFLPLGRKGDALDLGATPVNADEHVASSRVCVTQTAPRVLA